MRPCSRLFRREPEENSLDNGKTLIILRSQQNNNKEYYDDRTEPAPFLGSTVFTEKSVDWRMLKAQCDFL